MTAAHDRYPKDATVYLAAMRFEAAALLRLLEGKRRIRDPQDLPVVAGSLGGRPAVIAISGIGEQAARKAAETCVRLAGHGRCRRVVWVGIAGGLSPDLQVGDLIVARSAIAPDGPAVDLDDALVAAATTRGCRAGVVVTAPRVITGAGARAALWRRAGSPSPAAVDMESWPAARVLHAAGVPFAVLRAVSDTAAKELPGFLQRVDAPDAGETGRGRILRAAIMRPANWAALAAFRLRAARCVRRLAAVAAALSHQPAPAMSQNEQ
ncbi:MAG: hypothetical protein OXG81_00325 [Acidobacteria bacterium]|nr:hypothetical protein [Acidobacteriota bacterium]